MLKMEQIAGVHSFPPVYSVMANEQFCAVVGQLIPTDYDFVLGCLQLTVNEVFKLVCML